MHHTHRFLVLILAAAFFITAAYPAEASAPTPEIPDRISSSEFDLAVVSLGGLDVSTQSDTVTLFAAPLSNNVIGLVAHNYLAGATFYRLGVGDSLILLYPDAHQVRYRVESVHQYQAIGGAYPYYEFIDLESGLWFSDVEVYNREYLDHPGALILQTCLDRYGKSDWGLTFWIIYPDPELEPNPSQAAYRLNETRHTGR